MLALDFNRYEGAVFPLQPPLVLNRRSRHEQFEAGSLEPRGVLGGNNVEDPHPEELVTLVSEEPARRTVDIGETGVEVRLEKGVGRELDDFVRVCRDRSASLRNRRSSALALSSVRRLRVVRCVM